MGTPSTRITLRNRVFLKRITPYAQGVEPGAAREDLQRNDYQGQAEPGQLRMEAPKETSSEAPGGPSRKASGSPSREVIRETSEGTPDGVARETPGEARRQEGTSSPQAVLRRGTRPPGRGSRLCSTGGR